MTHTVVFRPEAKTDLIQGNDWYERQRSGLGEVFADAVDETISRIESMPKMYAVVFRNASSESANIPVPDLLSAVARAHRSVGSVTRQSRSKALAREG